MGRSSGQLLSGGRIGLHGALGAASVRRGFVAGTLVLDGAGNTISGDLRWKLPPLRDVRYPAGLDTMLAPIGDRYTRSTTAHGALGSAVPVVRTFQFSEGVFPVPVFANVTFGVPLIADTFAAPITYFATSPSIGKVLGYAKPVTVRYSFDGIILQLRGEIHGAVRSTTTLSAVGSE